MYRNALYSDIISVPGLEQARPFTVLGSHKPLNDILQHGMHDISKQDER